MEISIAVRCNMLGLPARADRKVVFCVICFVLYVFRWDEGQWTRHPRTLNPKLRTKQQLHPVTDRKKDVNTLRGAPQPTDSRVGRERRFVIGAGDGGEIVSKGV